MNPEAGKATNLDADELDGLDSTTFVAGIYLRSSVFTHAGGGTTREVTVGCDSGDRALGGSVDGNSGVLKEDELNRGTYRATIKNDFGQTQMRLVVTCADFLPLTNSPA